jgi:hypothetical protein
MIFHFFGFFSFQKVCFEGEQWLGAFFPHQLSHDFLFFWIFELPKRCVLKENDGFRHFFSHHLALLAAALPSVKVWQSPAIFSSPNGKLKMNTFFLDKSLMRWRAGPACSQPWASPEATE